MYIGKCFGIGGFIPVDISGKNYTTKLAYIGLKHIDADINTCYIQNAQTNYSQGPKIIQKKIFSHRL